MSVPPQYRGRFAPSPTGHLHFGSLLAATASYLDAKAHNGTWLVRMEDLDPPREQAGAADDILRTLDAFGLHWDETVVYQSQRSELYQHAIEQLNQQGLLYACHCTRKAIIARCKQGEYGAIYDGHCQNANLSTLEPKERSRRIKADGVVEFDDLIQGHISQNLSQDIGDFHLIRRDGLFAYHIGVVVDDYEQGITHIVRGFDLLDSTPRQLYLMQCLGYLPPQYAHIPLATHPDKQKLSKQTSALALDPTQANRLITSALHFLGQNPPDDLHSHPIEDIWMWAVAHWHIDNIPKTDQQPSPYR